MLLSTEGSLLALFLCYVADGLQYPLAPSVISRENNCIDGHLAPELVLLGAARASTSLFAANVHKSPDIVFPQCLADEIETGDRKVGKCWSEGVKELHLFDREDRMARGKGHWLQHYPKCNSSDTRKVSTDLSPAYLADKDVPAGMNKFYGNHLSKVTFLVFLRDPLRCMHSLYYYESRDAVGSFKAWADNMLVERDEDSRYFKNANYAKNLKTFWKVMDPSQFIIVPMKYNVVGGKDGNPEVTEFVWNLLGLSKPDVGTEEVEELNQSPHPEIEDDLDAQTLASVQDFVASVTGPQIIAPMLANANTDGQGPVLYGYTGTPTDEDAIAAWIESGW